MVSLPITVPAGKSVRPLTHCLSLKSLRNDYLYLILKTSKQSNQTEPGEFMTDKTSFPVYLILHFVVVVVCVNS